MNTDGNHNLSSDEKLKEAAKVWAEKTDQLQDAAKAQVANAVTAFAEPAGKLAEVMNEKMAGATETLAGLADKLLDAISGKEPEQAEHGVETRSSETAMTNKELVRTFIDEVFNAHDLSKLDLYMKDDYMQHSVEVADGKEGFRRFCEGFFQLEPFMDVKQIFESDDNTVAVFFKCCFNNGHAAKVVDMYRIEDGKLAEHWDVVQQLTEEDAANNGRGSF